MSTETLDCGCERREDETVRKCAECETRGKGYDETRDGKW